MNRKDKKKLHAVSEAAKPEKIVDNKTDVVTQTVENMTDPGFETKQGTPQKFIKNDKYFTISIYAFILVVCCAFAIKAIVNLDQTTAFLGGIARALSPFLIGLLIAFFLMPFVRAMAKLLKKVFKKINPKVCGVLSILIVYVIALGLVVMLLIYILPEVVDNIGELIKLIPTAYREVIEFVEEMQVKFPNVDFSSIMNMLQTTQSDLMAALQDMAGKAIPVLYTASVSIVQWMGNFLIAVIVSVYMIYGQKHLLRSFKIAMHSAIPEKYIPATKEICKDCAKIFSAFLVSKMIDSLIIGVLCAILMTILNLPYVFLISVFVGITNMIPYFGPFIGAVPGIIIILVQSPVKALVFAILILALQQFDGLYLGPKLMGDAMKLKAIWIIFAITIGGKFFGVLGMFLGVPFMAILAYLLDRLTDYRLAKKNMTADQIQ